MNIEELSNEKYTIIDENILDDGAYSNIYDIINTKDKTKKYILKLQQIKYKYEAINEIEILLKIKKNKHKYLTALNNINIPFNDSILIDLIDYYIDDEYIYIILEKYNCTLEYFNILYNKEIKETLPINLIKKIINSLFLGIYELNLSNIIHCDIKPNNVLINLKYKNMKSFIKDIKNKKIKKDDIINYIDIKIIDFNKSQKQKNIHKSTNIQILYYMAPEIIINDKNFNKTVDIWSIGIIFYELLTGKFLFDVYNENEQNGNHFEFYDLTKKSKITTNYNCGSGYYDYKDNKFECLSLLYMYKFILGDNTYIYSNNDFYYNNKLIGDIDQNISNNKLISIINNNVNNIDKSFMKQIENVFSKIFIYDYKSRLTPEEFLTKYIFL